MNRLKTTIISSVLFGVVLVILIPSTLFYAPEEPEAYIVANAEFADTSFGSPIPYVKTPNPESLPARFHALKPGNNAMVVLRRFRQENSPHCCYHQKFTIQIPELKDGVYELGTADVKAYFSRGISYTPYRQCGEEIKNGSIEITRVNDQEFKIVVKANFNCLELEKWSLDINETWIAETRPLDEMSFWLGKPGGDQKQMTHPKNSFLKGWQNYMKQKL